MRSIDKLENITGCAAVSALEIYRCRFAFIRMMSAAIAFFLSAALAEASPLVIYDDPNLAGSSEVIPDTYTVYSGGGIPGGMNNKTSSFQLDQGYMVVLTDLSDGTGASKVYIADSAPLTVTNLPPELDNTISFIRIIPWKYTLKKGTCTSWSEDGLNESWYYTWGYDVTRGQMVQPREYVPMSWGKGGSDPEAITAYLSMDQVTHLLSFNEPDHCDAQSGQYWNLCDVPTAVGYHENLMKAGLRLGSPAGHEEAANSAASWVPTFLQQCDAADIRNDFVCLHWYDWGSSPASSPNADPQAIFNRFKKYLSNAYHLCGERPLWITEFNANLNRVRSVQDGFLELALPYLETLGYVERYSYFEPNGGNGSFFNVSNQLTSTGQIYHDHVSTPAYTPKGLAAPWQNQDIGAVAAAGSAIHAHNGTFTVSGSGADIWGSADEFHYVYQPIPGNAEIIARVNSMVQRDNWTKSGIMIRETLDAGSPHASLFISAASGAAFQYRSATGGASAGSTQAGIEAPYWVKLHRQGNTLTGYISQDGSTWNQLGSQAIPMSTTVYIGLAVTSHNDGTYNDATFTDVSIWIEDSDSDELPDAWEMEHFGDLLTSSGGSDNQDGDPCSDLLEFLAGTNPTNAAHFFQPALAEADPGTLEVTFSAISNRLYVLETGTTLSNGWSESASVSPSSNGLQRLPFTDPADPPSLFGRIGISRP